MTAELILFYALALVALFSALAMVVLMRNVVAGIMSLVVTMISLSGIFVLLGADFVGVVQIMIYAGAIMVLLLFVVMLFDLESDAFGPEPLGRGVLKLLATLAAAAVGVLLIRALSPPMTRAVPPPDGFGGHRELARALFTEFVLPLEVIGLLLLAGIVGALILAKRRID